MSSYKGVVSATRPYRVSSVGSRRLSAVSSTSKRNYLPLIINTLFKISDAFVYVPFQVCFTAMVCILHIEASLSKSVCPLRRVLPAVYNTCARFEASYTRWRRAQKQYWGEKWRIHDVKQTVTQVQMHLPRDLTREVMDFHSDFSRYTTKKAAERQWNLKAYQQCF